jgi:hypothetical protein
MRTRLAAAFALGFVAPLALGLPAWANQARRAGRPRRDPHRHRAEDHPMIVPRRNVP